MDLHRDSRIQLSDGNKMPVIGLGTYSPEIHVSQKPVEEATKRAIEAGYRHIDAAFFYQNEAEIGRAIQEKMADGTVKREDIFYTGKVWCTFLSPDMVRPNLEQSLKSLQLDYLDLYLIHWPVSLKALEACKDAGLVKSIGVSNFNIKQLERILTKPGLKHKPVCNQVECHPYLTQKNLHAFCKSHGITMVCYSVLGTYDASHWKSPLLLSPEEAALDRDVNNPTLLKDPILLAIAGRHKKQPAQIAIRYILQRGMVPLVKSFTLKNIKSNLQVFDFELTAEDMDTLDGLNRNFRYWTLDSFKQHPEYPFNDE
ncbi:prostaglandin F synthase 1-like isoform X2 [Pleurodeles waltl]|uniref:prostaglandin F synthase 1-like isoform X2 n=1 Tax=Pleurodeles waltl TaxID=8319 RepID=UPI003709AECE